MSRRPEPRRIVLDGVPAIALTPQEYERLVLARRQLGGQSSRMSALNRDLSLAADLLDEARAELCATADGHGHCPAVRSGQDGERVCCRIKALLGSARFAVPARSSAAADSGPKPRRRTRGATGHR
ncbi:hypothetical protein ABZ858_26625 [Streptomyces sp. NPDC047017]|uniref:hypothetical protein n=1 Tax=Streptomyces sp. NPDC047017 TaxID=3155024 RepID=UPI0033D25524